MEPISELATRITSHLWILHSLYPDEPSLGVIRAGNWQSDLERNSANDYSLLQLLLDLVGDSLEKECRRSVSETKPRRFRRLILHPSAWKPKSNNPPQETAEPEELARKAVEILARRIETVREQGMEADLTFAASCPSAAFQQTKQISPARILTREELFQNVANWLLRCEGAKLHAFAESFLGDALFLMEEEITRCADAIQRTAARRPVAQIARDWLTKNKDERRAMVLRRTAHPEEGKDQASLRELCKQLGVPVPFSIVLSDELDEIARSRLVRLYGYKADPSNLLPAADARAACGLPVELAVTSQQAFKSSLFGVALSGGGIRSATFALGLLQGMADRNLLPYIDILSTVSGGGYLGSWLISWAKRRGGIDVVQESLRGSASLLTLGSNCPGRRPENAGPDLSQPFEWVSRNSDPHSDHVRPVRLLRSYSRYLAPQAGFFSADTWTIAATWFRNTALNVLVLALFFGAALMLPRLAIFLVQHLANLIDPNPSGLKQLLTTLAASVPLLAACVLIRVRNLNAICGSDAPARKRGRVSRGDNDTNVVFGIVPCIWLGAFLQLVVLWNSVRHQSESGPVTAGFALALAIGVGILGIGMWSPDQQRTNLPSVAGNFWRILTRPVAFAGTVLVGWLLIELLYTQADTLIMNTQRGLWIAASLGFALVLTWVAAIVLVLVGLFGRDLSDEHREWWSRLGAWLTLSIGVWLVICAICFFMPLWIALLGVKTAAAGISWMAITTAGVKFAFSPHSGRDAGSSNQSRLKTIIMNLAPAVFVVGSVSAESFALFWLLERFINWRPGLVDDPVAHQLCCTGTSVSFQSMLDNYWQLMYPGSLAPLILIFGFVGVCLYLASRVDINEFSMHNFYKNRLVRAYLGASRARAHRMPNAFTGFDPDDDIRLSRFQCGDASQPRDKISDCRASYAGPFPIINTALNITRGEELGLQERKAESFIFTPLWSGFDFSRRQAAVRKTAISEFGFQRTDLFGVPGRGALLGTAMAISGAAFNANAGFQTKPSLAFLLTVFGVRLGWWAGNPRTAKWTSPSPAIGLLYLLKELTANTSTNENFVLLSDGGHFENMGLYELIRRRCRFIILSDAEEDEKFKLEGIGGAIRKCRDDFGVVIDLNLDTLQPIGDPGVSRLHYSLGTIIYPGECSCGKLIYIKSSVTADEPIDVIEFRKRHSEFPHTSTANQFFDESHFESYRALGHHVASQVFTHNMGPLPLQSCQNPSDRLEEMFRVIENDLIKRLNLPAQKAREALATVINKDEEQGESK